LKEARHHHFIPQFYLKRFAKPDNKKLKIIVIDLQKKVHLETTPRNVGGKKDFNRVETKGILPDGLENLLSSFEGKAENAIDEIRSNLKFQGEPRKCILNLIALLAIRSPQAEVKY